MNLYPGARFYKCDLHMHSPMDRKGWKENSTKLKHTDTEDRKREIAQLYLRQCHKEGLEVIAITDHNFAPSPEQSFLKWLRDENGPVAAVLDKPPLHIFGGFETEADVGTGHHVLCILPIDMALHVIDSRAVSCGLQPEERFDTHGNPRQSTMRLTDIIKAIQKTTTQKGVVICAHPFNKKGLLCDVNAQMWLQQEEFRNSDLLCIEIPKQVHTMPLGLRKLIIGGNDCQPEWRRRRPIAYLMSSDTHRICPDSHNPGNHIGYRHTWIKMSRPSIESLRQAFLDRESRIRFGDRRPEEGFTYQRIARIEVDGASFYQAEPLELSSNLNCIIGSRGTGKSTVLDYVRSALDRLRPGDLPQRIKEEVDDRVSGTLSDNGCVTITVLKDGVPYKIEFITGAMQRFRITNLHTNESDPRWEIRSLFNAKILSQREIDQSIDSNDSTPLRRLLDDFIRLELDAKADEARRIISEIERIDIEISSLIEKQLGRPAVETDKARLEATLKLLETLRDPLQRWDGISKEEQFFAELFDECQAVLEQTRQTLQNISLKSTRLSDELMTTPNHEVVVKAVRLANSAARLFISSIQNAINGFERRSVSQSSSLKALYKDQWLAGYEQEKTRVETIKQELEAKGDKPEEFLQYRQQLEDTKRKVTALDSEREEIDRLEGKRAGLLRTLRSCWKEETRIRKQKAEELMEHLTLGVGTKSFVDISIKHQGDVTSLLTKMCDHMRDRRRLDEGDIENVVQEVELSPVQYDENGHRLEIPLIERVIEECRRGAESEVLRQVLSDRKMQAFKEYFNETVLRKLELSRIPDKVQYLVYRQDGSPAGPIEKVSVGQRGLAFLNLLLASGDEPLIIDTPEEGLDNEGVYTELVPILRREKEKRQIIVATHNANIPVNADAELIVALEAVGFVDEKVLRDWIGKQGGADEDQVRHIQELIEYRPWESMLREYLVSSLHWDSRSTDILIDFIQEQRQAKGHLRNWQEKKGAPREICVGALDCPSVNNAVQDIMEGSEEAFAKRSEKYGF